MLENRAAVPACLPPVLRRRHLCASERVREDGTFRVDVDAGLLDAWLLTLCTRRDDPAKPTVLERMTVRLRTTRGAGPAARRLRPDSRAACGSGRATPHAHRLGLRGLTRRHRRIGPL
ncbi:hypothetical protein Cs7R123_45160 [Catellatospora sp. TT07R-123]|uniref:hypothetical protein n=1 Tax=Catellatospora sp. TT07R-123 TaxID=2733863 RepID=UPI001B26A04C|nr:hypothetical protein [Catellatospora sp. TT07R-123]GHJ47174.1 hypothetical protein Cs7R123_45160 [Catellatospora sp. TT07R-123]